MNITEKENNEQKKNKSEFPKVQTFKGLMKEFCNKRMFVFKEKYFSRKID